MPTSIFRALLVLAAGVTALTTQASAATDEADCHLIDDVTTIDAHSGPRAHQSVVFCSDAIIYAGPAGAVPPNLDAARRVDGSNRFLIPGLWDMHVHMTYEPELTATMPALFLAYGVTSVRDTGGEMAKVKPIIDAMRQPDALSPRVYFAGPLLDGASVVYNGIEVPRLGIANPTTAAVEENLDRLQAAGVDFIKIYELVSPQVFAALARSAKRRGLPIAGHIPLSSTASAAGPLLGTMEHLRNIELDCAANHEALADSRRARLAAHDHRSSGGSSATASDASQAQQASTLSGRSLRAGMHTAQRLPAIGNYDADRCLVVLKALRNTIQVPTLRLNALADRAPFSEPDFVTALASLPPGLKARWNATIARPLGRDPQFARWSRELIRHMYQLDVPIAAGTDTPIGISVPGYSLHRELELLVESGLPPLAALAAATTVPPMFFGHDQLSGRIAPGAKSDLVLLRANPLDDIRNTRAIDLVISRGLVLEPAQLLHHPIENYPPSP